MTNYSVELAVKITIKVIASDSRDAMMEAESTVEMALEGHDCELRITDYGSIVPIENELRSEG